MSRRVAARFSQPAVKAAWFPFWMQLPAAVAAAAGPRFFVWQQIKLQLRTLAAVPTRSALQKDGAEQHCT